jgi:ABC-2 type transport system ATP-binding protein
MELDTAEPAVELPEPGGEPRAAPAVYAHDVSRAFGDKQALSGVSFTVEEGQIHALLGPNGAGKTTLLRIVTGLLHADTGEVSTAGYDPTKNPKALRQRVGLVPSADRTFYLRLNGLENLVFFGRLYGLKRKAAVARALEVMEQVGLSDAVKVRVGVYSHGMQKRLSMARALLTEPDVLLIDEATHDLDPEGAMRVRDLVAAQANQKRAVVWTTQRVEEIRGFADHVTLLMHGRVRFHGTVPELIARSNPRRFFVHLGRDGAPLAVAEVRAAIGASGEIFASEDGDEHHFVLALAPAASLGEAVNALTSWGIDVVSCTEEQPKIEQAFLSLTQGEQEAVD